MYAPTPLVNASMKQETYISMISAIRPIFNFIASSTKFTEKNRLQTIHRNSKFSIFNVTHSHHLLNLFAIAITMSINYCWVRWLRFQRNRTGKDKQLNKYFFDLSNSLNVLAPLRSLTHHIFSLLFHHIYYVWVSNLCFVTFLFMDYAGDFVFDCNLSSSYLNETHEKKTVK